MNAPLAINGRQNIVYPDSDGQPMADNTRQFRWIVTIQGGLDALYVGDPNVFVAGDLLWYPVEGRPDIRMAPDTLVVFGRPKGDRGSYRQWVEAGIAPQVVFEVWSPGNRPKDYARKLVFYERYGVEEFYFYDPDNCLLEGWLRKDGQLQEIENMIGWVSPRLGIRFDMEDGELVLYRPDGKRFLTFVELQQQRDQEARAAEQARLEAERARKSEEVAKQQTKAADERATVAEAETTRLRALVEQLQRQAGQA